VTGGGLNRLPGRNFARFNLMIYILFCLVVRTGYQGKQFEFMLKVEFDSCLFILTLSTLTHQEIRPKNVKTIAEMMEKNFELYASEYPMEMMKDMEFGSKYLKRVLIILFADVILFEG
jgi:hypothetical protein